MQVSELTDAMIDECSYIVIYTDNESPFFAEDDNITSHSEINWVLHCDWSYEKEENEEDEDDEEDEKWKNWQHGWGRQSKIVLNDIKDVLPKPYRFVVFRSFSLNNDDNENLEDVIMEWITAFKDENKEENKEEKKKKNKLEKMLNMFNDCLEDFYSDCYISNIFSTDVIKDMIVTLNGDYLFVKWNQK